MANNTNQKLSYFEHNEPIGPPPGLYPPLPYESYDKSLLFQSQSFVKSELLIPQSYVKPELLQPQTYVKPNFKPSSYQSNYEPVQSYQPVQANIEQSILKYKSFEPNAEKKKRLEHDLQLAKQTVDLLEKELKKLNELIEVNMSVNKLRTMQENVTQPVPMIYSSENITKQNCITASDKFIQAVNTLFMKENPISMANIPHKLPRDVLPPKGIRGLFTLWMEQVPGCKIIINNNNNNRKEYLCWIDHNNTQIEASSNIQIKTKKKICWQKQRGKPCKIDKNGECISCDK